MLTEIIKKPVVKNEQNMVLRVTYEAKTTEVTRDFQMDTVYIRPRI